MLCPYCTILDVFVVERHLNLETTKMNMMRGRQFRILSFLRIVVTCFMTLIFLPTFALSEETYVFERMWPTLQQPWYFFLPTDIAINENGSVYVADTYNHRIQKFTSDGFFIKAWGQRGNGEGEFDYPYGIAIDTTNSVYVADNYNHRIQKFNSAGQFITKWGSQGGGDGELLRPRSIAIDAQDNVYVADTGNHRIQKFNSDGQFITKWGNQGSGDGQFDEPSGIAVDHAGNVYVTDSNNHRVQKFTPEGVFVSQWGSFGSTDGNLNIPIGITVDRVDNIYVTDSQNHRVQKFDPNGVFVAKWGQNGNGEGEFGGPRGIEIDNRDNVFVADWGNDRIQKFTTGGQYLAKWGGLSSEEGMFDWPMGITIDVNGNVYIADTRNNRVQKFTEDGQFITRWGSEGSGDEQFIGPTAMALDNEGNIYMTDSDNHRIQKFTPDGQFITKWGQQGSGDGEFNNPWGIAADQDGNIYVVDFGNNRVQKFTPDGQFLIKWGSFGESEGQFHFPLGIAVSEQGDVYVADQINDRIQKFSSNGQFIDTWGVQGSGDGNFNGPSGVAIDSDGNILVSDRLNYRIQKFTPSGQFITKWGTSGSYPGQMNWVDALAASPNGKIYIADSKNHRIQVFKKVTLETNPKAIIIAGGGPFSGNNLWDATQMCANFAYRALTYQGFTKETIYYLTSDTDLDLDNNGELDDVDGDATNSNLHDAITTWAADADSLVVYLVDHGGNGTFRMSGTETLSASDMDSWLDTLQETMPGKVIVIYDACESGSFLSSLTPPAEKERIVITSTSPGESAYFVTQGSISFSNYFWTHIFNGVNLKDSFDLAKDAIGYTTDFQTPLLDANGNGVGNEPEDGTLVQDTYIGNGTVIHGDAPVIGSVSPDQIISGTSSALLYASGVTDNDGIARVWAVIRPPDYNQGSSDNPVQELPSLDLMPTGADQYEATYNGFTIEGTYQIAIYARDRIGNTSIPQLTSVSVENPLRRRAIMVVGGLQTDDLWPSIEKSATLVYEALTFQGYTDDAIYFMSNVTFSTGVDGSTTLSNINYALTTWAATNTQDVVVYLVGNGAEGSFEINDTETLLATDLDTWLDSLQDTIPGKVTVIYDACRSGSFLSLLTPSTDKERILVSSTGENQPAYFLSEGDISFSKFFWRRVLNGANVRNSFLHAKNALAFSCLNQTPYLDDNGNGVGNEKPDGQLARYYTIGVGIMLAGDDPLIGSISPEQILDGETTATIWVEDVTTTGTIDKVWAVITPPGYSSGQPSNPVTDVPTLDLTHMGGGRYEGTYSDFTTIGIYEIAVYAMDTEGNISFPKESRVYKGFGPDTYEEDDTVGQSNVIVINNETPQQHTFHDAGDQDWIKFYGLSEEAYTIKASNLGSNCDAVIELYDTDGTTLLASIDDGLTGEDELLDWACLQDGIYYVKVRHYDSGVYGENTDYDLKVYIPIGPITGWIEGTIKNKCTGEPIVNALIKTNGGSSAISLPNGAYLIIHEPGTFTVTAEASGYTSVSYPDIEVGEAGTTTVDFEMASLDDSDGDGYPDDCDPFPTDPNEWLDTDSDGIGNNQDTDDDNDKMPDTWEIQYGLDPLDESDASGDLDGDGISNVDEYLAGTDPTNAAPNPPVLSSPTNGQSSVLLTPVLQTGAFSDPDDGDTHAHTQWQISTQSDFSSLVLDVTGDSLLTSLTVPEFIVSVNTTYYWRVKFFDNRGAASEWSDPYYSFTTIDASASDDTDSNGIPDNQEVDDTVDLDGDGNPDYNQSDIKSVNTVVGNGQIGVKEESTNITSIDSIKSIDPDDISDTTNKPDEMPLGLITFRLTVDTPGDDVEVVVYLSEPVPSGATWYKYDTIHGWREYLHATIIPGETYVTLALKDGDWEYGDSDGTENRIIIDPSGLAAASTPSPPPPAPSGGGGGGGCFIATAAHGSYMEPHVKVLREFRDRFLVTNYVGKAFINLYTTVSPPVANFIANHDTIRFMVRWSLVPLVGMSWVSINIGLCAALVFIGLLICFMGFSATIALRRMLLRRKV
jgi:DNA-binding beta-propeller fold protein YncE